MTMQNEITEINALNEHWMPHIAEQYETNQPDQYLVKGCNLQAGIYYHNCRCEEDRESILRSGFNFKKTMDRKNGFGRGLFCGRDREAVFGFYTSDLSKPRDSIITINGEFRFISFLCLDKLNSFLDSFASPGWMQSWLFSHHYDGIRYYDPHCTGEEFVLYKLEGIFFS